MLNRRIMTKNSALGNEFWTEKSDREGFPHSLSGRAGHSWKDLGFRTKNDAGQMRERILD
jgi:hypothetical protein